LRRWRKAAASFRNLQSISPGETMTSGIHVVRAADAVAYQPPNHTGVGSRRLQGLEAGGPTGCAVAISEYPTGASAASVPTPLDTVYVVLAGELTLTTADGDVILGVRDSVFLPIGTVRSVHNRSQESATLLVLVIPN
jgi:mannose-6-phosphate isomerase-like protein (cupin superfamily)